MLRAVDVAMKPHMREDGFTLIEVMVSIAILAIAFVTLLGLRDRAILLIDRADKIYHASIVADRLMHRFETENPQTDTLSGSEEGFDWNLKVTDFPVVNIKEWRLILRLDNTELELIEYVPG